ncbi:MAG: LPXTG cell wall anchor domain-containing protein [Eubacteriales bacterium]
MKKLLSIALAGAIALSALILGTVSVAAEGTTPDKTIATVDEYIAFVNEANEQGEGYMLGKTVAITADLDFTGKTVPAIQKGKFVLDGSGKTLSNINTTVTAADNGKYGLLANELGNQNFNGVIRNVVVKDSTLTVSGEASNIYVGGIVGLADRAHVTDVTLDNVTINVEGSGKVGAIIGLKDWAAGDNVASPNPMTNITVKNSAINAPKADVALVVGEVRDDAKAIVSNLTVDGLTVTSNNEVKADTLVVSTSNADNFTVGENISVKLEKETEQQPDTGDGDKEPETPVEPPKTGDIAVALSALALVAVAGAVVVARKRKIED